MEKLSLRLSLRLSALSSVQHIGGVDLGNGIWRAKDWTSLTLLAVTST